MQFAAGHPGIKGMVFRMDKQIRVKFHVSFQPGWVLARRDASALPVDQTASRIVEKLEGEIIRSNLTECEGVLTGKDASEAEKALNQLIADTFDISVDDTCFAVAVEVLPAEEAPAEPETPKAEAPAEPAKPEAPAEPAKPATVGGFPLPSSLGGAQQQSAAAKKQPEAQQTSAETPEAVMAEIEALIGAEPFKEICREAVSIAPRLKENDMLEAFTRRCYLFAVNDGCGLTHYLELYAKLIEALGLFNFHPSNSGLPISFRTDKKAPVVEAQLPPPDSDQNPEAAMKNILQQGKNYVVCIDISAWMSKITSPVFRSILRQAELSAGESIICFRVPFIEHTVLHNLHKALNDQLFIRDVAIVPFECAELEIYGRKLLENKSFTVEDAAWELFKLRLHDEKNDGRFYGFHTVRKVVLEMLYMKQLFDVQNGISDKVIKAEEIKDLCISEHSIEKTGEEMLADLVGMEAISDQVHTVIGQILAALENDKLEMPCIHMRFLGNPGTGKTTVARIIGKLLAEKGVLRVGAFIERNSRELCGRYIGETAPLTAAACRDAYGSVLFIDEAYSLYRGGDASKRDYGLEAIDTLIAEMENHRSDMVVIMAGYTDDMETLMGANAGLRSRMPFEIRFPNYTKEQLAEIFLRMASKSFTWNEDFEQAIRDYFMKLDQAMIDSKEFSNARFVRNLYERTWGKAVLRCQMASQPCKELRTEDFALAVSDSDFQNIIGKPARTLGFS